MTDPTAVELVEYGTATVELDPATVHALARERAVQVTGSVDRPGCFELKAGSTVGVLVAGGCEVRIRPKVPVDRLLFLASFAADQSGWGEEEPGFASADELAAGAAIALVTLVERALAHGVLQGYRSVEEALPLVRGRIHGGAQLARRAGLALPVEVVYDEFTTDIDENRILRTALVVARRLPRVPHATLAKARHLLGRLERVGELVQGQPLPPVRITRLNRRYAKALGLARLVLEATSFDVAAGDHRAVQFLFDMNRVFEDFLTATLVPALGRRGGRVQAQRSGRLDHDGALRFAPDLTWDAEPGQPRAVIDAKYKSIATTALPNADVYQALAYATTLGLGDAHLVYAAGNERPAVHDLVGSGVRVHVHALDLDVPPASLLARVERLADTIAAAS